MKVHLIRHGKTWDAKKKIHQRDEATVIRSLIDPNLYKDLKVEKVYASPYKRTQQTAKILFGEFETLDFIHEYKAPSFLKGGSREKGAQFWEQHLKFPKSDPDWKHSDDESFNELLQRIKKLISFLQSTNYNSVAVVGHGTYFRHLMGYLNKGDKYTFNDFTDIYFHLNWPNLQKVEVEL